MADYINLFSLLRGNVPPWEVTSLDRCVKAGYVHQRGLALTADGKRKAQALGRYVRALKSGLPIQARTATRERDLLQERWFSTEMVGVECVMNYASVLYAREIPAWLTKHSGRLELTEDSSKKLLFAGIIRASQDKKLEPYAVQLDDLGGTEVICFRAVTKPSIKIRVRSAIYDVIELNYHVHSWWINSDRDMVVVRSESPNGKGIKNGMLAIVKPFHMTRRYP